MSPRGTLVPQFVREDKEGAAGCVRAQTMKRYRRNAIVVVCPTGTSRRHPRACHLAALGKPLQERSFLPEHHTVIAEQWVWKAFATIRNTEAFSWSYPHHSI